MLHRRRPGRALAPSTDLGPVDCEVVDHAPPGLPLIARDRWHLESDARVVVPRCGAAVALVGPRTPTVGYLVLRPARGHRSVELDRRAVVALADDVARMLEA